MLGQATGRIFAAARPRCIPRTAPTRRFLSTAPPHAKSRTWKNSAARWAIAGGLIYYYNTSTAFADESPYTTHAPPETKHELEQESYQSIDELAAQRQLARQKAAEAKAAAASHGNPDAAVAGSPEELEEEAGQQGAFNEETGEINWDCPCLGGMAHGPCGEEFRAAFSCFVFSKEEPKGVDCIDKFRGMQDCFRAHPDIYGSELEEDETAELIGEGGPGDVPEGAETGVGEAQAAAVTGAAPAVESEKTSVASRPSSVPVTATAEVESA